MPNYGIGIGAFLDGVGRGAGIASQIQDNKDRQRLRQMQMSELEQGASDRQAYRDLVAQGSQDARAARQADIGRSIIRGSEHSDAGPVPTFKVGDQTFDNEADATAAAEKQAGSFLDYYMQTTVPRMQEHWLSTGDVEKAQLIGKWMEDENVRKGAQSWANAVRSFQVGDSEGFKRNLMAAYNQQGYFDDGTEAVSIDDVNNEQGQLLGYKIRFRDADGNEREETYDGEDVAKMGLQALAPDQVLSYGLEQLKAAQEARASAAEDDRQYQRDLGKIDVQHSNALDLQNNKAALDAAAEAEKRRTGGDSTKVREANAMAQALRDAGWSDEKVQAEMPRLLGVYRQSQSPADRLASTIEMMAKTDMEFAGLPDDEKVSRARTLMNTMDAALAAQQAEERGQTGAAQPQTPVQSGRGLPIWDNKTQQLIYR